MPVKPKTKTRLTAGKKKKANGVRLPLLLAMIRVMFPMERSPEDPSIPPAPNS